LKAIKFSDTLYVACQMLGEDIYFVSQGALPGFMAILAKAYFHIRCGVYNRAEVHEKLEQIADLPSGFKQTIMHEWQKFDESDKYFLDTMRQGAGKSNLHPYANGASIESASQIKSSYGPLARLQARRQVAKAFNAINQSNQDQDGSVACGDMSQEREEHPSAELEMAYGSRIAIPSMSQDVQTCSPSEMSTRVSVIEDNPLFISPINEEPTKEKQQQLDSQLERVQSKSMELQSSRKKADNMLSSDRQQMDTLQEEVREMRTEIQDVRALIVKLGSDLEAKIHAAMNQ